MINAISSGVDSQKKQCSAVLCMNRELEQNAEVKELMRTLMSAYIVPETMPKVGQQSKGHWLKEFP